MKGLLINSSVFISCNEKSPLCPGYSASLRGWNSHFTHSARWTLRPTIWLRNSLSKASRKKWHWELNHLKNKTRLVLYLPLSIFWAFLNATLITYLNGSQSGDPGPSPSLSSGNVLETQIIELWSRLKSETVEVEPSSCVLTNFLGHADAH